MIEVVRHPLYTWVMAEINEEARWITLACERCGEIEEAALPAAEAAMLDAVRERFGIFWREHSRCRLLH